MNMLRTGMRQILRAGAIALAAGLLGCGGTRSVPAPGTGGSLPPAGSGHHESLTVAQRAQLQRNFAHALSPQAYAALQQLGLPATPAHQSSRHVSVSIPFSFPAVQAYTAGDAGYIASSADVVFGSEAQFAPAGGSYPDNFSYVIYRIDAVPAGARTIHLTPDTGSGSVGVAVYNWAYGSLGRWEPLFFGSAATNADIPLDDTPGASFTNGNGDLAFVVFCLNPSQINIDNFQLDDVSTDAAPTADIQPSPGSGVAPLSVTLDASASIDPDGSIVDYQFDPLGDGNWIDKGTTPNLDTSYDTPGAYNAQVKVTDDRGLSSTMSTTVIASPASYDEVEDNDDVFDANALPALPFASFFGNLGLGGYDGDQQDWFTFNANSGDEVNFLVNYSPAGGMKLNYWVEDSVGQQVTELGQSDGWPPQRVAGTIPPPGQYFAPYYLRIKCVGGSGDYMIRGDSVVLDEVEDNDGAASAQYLANLDQSPHTLTNFDGSLGSGPGYPGYDGDTDDWFTFGALQNSHLDLTVTYDNGTGNVGVSLMDLDGDTLASSATDSGTETLNYDFQPGDNAPFFLHFASGSGYSDYRVNSTLTLNNPGFDENEDNDGEATANPLPAVPFSGFTGNIGGGGNYDGDMNDYFSFTGNAGDRFQFTVTATDPGTYLTASLYDSNGNPLGASSWDSPSHTLTANVMIRTDSVAPFYIWLRNDSTATDYTISATTVSTFDEVEDNDSDAEANVLPAGAVPFFSGSLGNGGGNYDGDSTDVYSFNETPGNSPAFDIYTSSANGVISAIIKDSDGDILGTSIDNGAGDIYITTSNPIGPGDTAPFFLEITANSGYSDYWFTRYAGGPPPP